MLRKLKQIALVFLFGICNLQILQAQTTEVKGTIVEAITGDPIPKAIVAFENSNIKTKTNSLGNFNFSVTNLPLGEHMLKVFKEGFITKRYPIVISQGKTLNLPYITLEYTVIEQSHTIALSDDELDQDTSSADNISGLLQASKDVFQRTAAFEFSPSFFSVRGLDSNKGTVLLNGIEMNKHYNGRPQWNNWGGLNDVTRNQEFTFGLTPSTYNFGGILGTTYINTRATSYKKGMSITYSSSNRSYKNRLMASYTSGLLKNNWAFAIMASRRWGNEGFQEGTVYDSNSLFASAEKVLNASHSVNITAVYTPNRRGKSSANTQEVFNLKGNTYNAYWGYLNGEKKNSRIKKVNEPIIILNHYWTISKKTTLNTNLGYQFGSIGNSRLDYASGSNPSPDYYQNLPSFFLANTPPNYEGAYLAEQEFINDGQINWERIFDANQTNAINNLPSAYALYEDRTDDTQFTINSIISSEINTHIILNAAINYNSIKSENYAKLLNLFGGSYYTNSDAFDGYDFDLLHPNRQVKTGEKFKYHYNLFSNVLSGFTQVQFNYNKIDAFVSANASQTSYQREGIYKNEAYANSSFGKGEKYNFTAFGFKAGGTYKISGKHIITLQTGYITKAPNLKNSFTNARSNHDVIGVSNNNSIPNTRILDNEKTTLAELNYNFRSVFAKIKLSGFYTKTENTNEIAFYYADGIEGFQNDRAFIQEVLHDINKNHIGIELGIESQITPTLKLKGALTIGQYTYSNNPRLYVTSDDLNKGFINYGTAYLKNYKLATGPQRAASIGFEYRDPKYWWFGATINFFSNTYIDPSPITRTTNFFKDNDGLPFNDYNPEIAKSLLKQEQFKNYNVVNLVGGKSWRIKSRYLGFFASIGNVLNTLYKTGGYEQGRNANYRELINDTNQPKRRFGPKYWYGRGTNYFVNFYVRF